MADQSPMHRLVVGDVVSYQDQSEWPPIDLEGTITAFANDVCSYLEITFSNDDVRILTEDEVKRVA
jgi:hypothetical protein